MITNVPEQQLTGSFEERWRDVPRWRRDPYRLLFPLGVALAWAGVSHWALHALGLLADYRSVFHAIVQIQGFMTCLVLGFLMTAIPRRTATPPPATWEMAVALAFPPLATVAAWFGALGLSQAVWVVLMLVLLVFVGRRFVSSTAGRRPPNSFVWIPLSFAMGIAGALLTATPGFVGDEYFWLHQLGRLLLLQGMMVGLIAGVGGMALPLITCGDSPPDGRGTARDRGIRLLHVAAAALLVASFWIEIFRSARFGLALRAVLTAWLLIAGARIWRRPRKAGLHRWFVWAGAWMVPLGYALAATFVEKKIAALHVVFIGGFAVLGLSIALHVTMAHGSRPQAVYERRWQVAAFGAFLFVAALLRTLVDFDPLRFFLWLGLSAAAFLVGSLFWFRVAWPHAR